MSDSLAYKRMYGLLVGFIVARCPVCRTGVEFCLSDGTLITQLGFVGVHL